MKIKKAKKSGKENVKPDTKKKEDVKKLKKKSDAVQFDYSAPQKARQCSSP